MMKNASALALLLCLLLAAGLTNCADKEEAVPSCLQVEVVGEDCANGWYVLRIIATDGANAHRSNQYIGQFQSGYVTTDNLPEELQVPGLLLQLSLERNSESGPRCTAIHMLYPPVRVKQVCSDL